jgi:hypothetical protein
MIHDDFYATVKLKTGEEIFSRISATEEENKIYLILFNPIEIEEIRMRNGNTLGYKVEPWLKTSHDDMFIIDMDEVLVLSESENIEMIQAYEEYSVMNTIGGGYKGNSKLDSKMGYISSVDEARKTLENIYNKASASE